MPPSANCVTSGTYLYQFTLNSLAEYAEGYLDMMAYMAASFVAPAALKPGDIIGLWYLNSIEYAGMSLDPADLGKEPAYGVCGNSRLTWPPADIRRIFKCGRP